MKPRQTILTACIAGALLALSCSKATGPAGGSSLLQGPVVLSTTTNFTEGNFDIMHTGSGSVTGKLLTLGTDDIVSTFGTDIYILERGLGNVIKLGSITAAGATVAYQVNLGASVNPQQIAFVSSTKAYITENNNKDMVIFNPTTGKTTGTVDLSRFDAYVGTDSAVSVPFMSPAMVAGNYLYVGCERLKVVGNYPEPADSSCIAVISTSNDSIVKTIMLDDKNPISMDTAGGKLYVVCPGNYGDYTDGDIECIDLTSQSNIGPVVKENQVNGDLGAIALGSSTNGYFTVGAEVGISYTNVVYSFNPLTSSLGSQIAGIGDASGVIGALICRGGYLYVADESATDPGIVTVETTSNTKVGKTAVLDLPPYSLAYLNIQ
jgi:hypothetical protein